MNKYQPNKGFTIIELMIATTIFSLVMLVCAYAITYIGRVYYKGVITARTQDTARRIIQEVSAAAQFSDATTLAINAGPDNRGGLTVYATCIGTTRFTYVRNRYLGEVPHVLWRDAVGETEGCVTLDMSQGVPVNPLTGLPEDGSELVGKNMRVPNFAVNDTGSLVAINLTVSYGDGADLFEPAPDPPFSVCQGVISGGQFCAVSSISTSVTKRL